MESMGLEVSFSSYFQFQCIKSYRVVKGGASKGRGFPNLPEGSPIFPRNP